MLSIIQLFVLKCQHGKNIEIKSRILLPPVCLFYGEQAAGQQPTHAYARNCSNLRVHLGDDADVENYGELQ